MSSTLQQLAAAVRGLADEAGQPMQVLAHLQQRARQLAAQADALGQDGATVAQRLSELGASLGAVSESMATLRGDAQRFAAFLASGGTATTGGAADGLPAMSGQGTSPESGTVAMLPRDADGRPRYDDPRTGSSPLAPQWEKFPDEYVPPRGEDWDGVPAVMLPFTAPQTYLPWVNDGGIRVPGRNVNCADCTRAVLSNHFGLPQVAAARARVAGNRPKGESFSQICSWRPGMQMTPTDLASIGSRLEALGPGSAAYVGVLWVKNGQPRGGHAFAAINDWGTPRAVDGQTGKSSIWPPTDPAGGIAWDPSSIGEVFVQYFDAKGNLVS